jgi:hypothetical protein
MRTGACYFALWSALTKIKVKKPILTRFYNDVSSRTAKSHVSCILYRRLFNHFPGNFLRCKGRVMHGTLMIGRSREEI